MLNDNTPWLAEEGWHNGKIHSNARHSYYSLLFITLFWNIVSFPIAYFALSDHYHGWHINHFDPVLLVLLFPPVGIILLFQLYKNYRQWSAFGLLSMTLDPYPGSIDGEVGGFVELPVAWRDGYEFKVNLNCIHYTISRQGSRNARHYQKVVWKKFAAVDYAASDQGIRLKFKTPVADDLHESDLNSKSDYSYYRWVVHIKGQYKNSNIYLDREFDIPVFKRAASQHSAIIITSPAPEIEVQDLSSRQVRIKHNQRSLELDYPRSRYASIGTALLFFALFFLLSGGFLGDVALSDWQRSSSFALLSALFTGFMSFCFGLTGILMLAYAVHLLSSHLTVLINNDGIHVKNHSLVYRSTQSVKLSALRSISKKSTMSSGDGVQAKRYFTISVSLANYKTLTLGNGIKGQLAADSLLKLIKQHVKGLMDKK